VKHLTVGLLIATTALGSVPALSQARSEPRLSADALDMTPARLQALRLPISLEAAEHARSTMMFAPGGEPLPIYLNRWGGTYYGGFDDSSTNYSSIVYGSSATVSGFGGNDDQWGTVLGCVQDMFSRFNVYVTDVEPLDGDYVEAVVGGSPQEMGMSWGVGGVAPYDPNTCGIISKGIVYAFAESYGKDEAGLQSLCETVTQEVAHAFTLDHEYMCEDPMTYLDGCEAKSFQDVYAPCGEWSERACTCGDGGETQNSVQQLYTLLGPGEGIEPPPPPNDLEPPQLALLSPEDGVTVLGNEPLEIVATASDDIGLVTVTLEWLFSGNGMSCPGEGPSWSCVVDGDRHTWTVDVSEGLREFKVRARDVMGKVTETETRWVWLGESLDEERPEDEVPPEVTLVSPANGGSVSLDDGEVVITAAVYDAETGVAEVGLVRRSYGGSYLIPCEEDDPEAWVPCVHTGGTYTWYMPTRRAGARDWAIYAKDFLGNEILSPTRTFHVVAGAIEVPAEDSHENNDTWDLAEDLMCGTALDLKSDAGDADWFTVKAPVGMLVDVKVQGEIADRLRLSAHSSPTIDGIMEHLSAKTGFEVEVPEEGLKIRVTSNGVVEGDYRLLVSCRTQPLPEVPASDSPFACAHVDARGGSTTLAGLFALFALGLATRRRRD